MTYVKDYQCTICHQVYDKDLDIMTCPTCGDKGILEIRYDYKEMKKEVTRDYFKHNTQKNILRYTPLMSIKPTTKEILSVGCTPLYQATNLGSEYGFTNLLLKDEGTNPTSSLKDRASLVACLKAIEKGSHKICCSSTGNAASSLAGNAAKLGLHSLIFIPERAPEGKLAQLVMYGSKVVKVKGDYKKAYALSNKVIKEYDLYNRNAAINPHLVEGKKTVAIEIAEQLDFIDIDYVFVSVGDGCTIGGVYKGFYDLQQIGLLTTIPKIIGVQSEGCSPFYDAFIHNRALEETEENTIADSIAVGIPRNPVKGMNAVKKSNGFYMTVTDQEILNTMVQLGKTEGIFQEPAGAAALAGLLQLARQNKIDKQSKIVVILTGNGLKDQQSIASYVMANTIQVEKEIGTISKHENPSVDEYFDKYKRGEKDE